MSVLLTRAGLVNILCLGCDGGLTMTRTRHLKPPNARSHSRISLAIAYVRVRCPSTSRPLGLALSWPSQTAESKRRLCASTGTPSSRCCRSAVLQTSRLAWSSVGTTSGFGGRFFWLHSEDWRMGGSRLRNRPDEWTNVAELARTSRNGASRRMEAMNVAMGQQTSPRGSGPFARPMHNRNAQTSFALSIV